MYTHSIKVVSIDELCTLMIFSCDHLCVARSYIDKDALSLVLCRSEPINTARCGTGYIAVYTVIAVCMS